MKANYGFWKYITQYKFSSIFIRSFFISLLVVLLPFLVMSYAVYRNSYGIVESEISAASMNSLSSDMEVTDSVLKELERMASKIMMDEDTEIFLFSPMYSILRENTFQNLRKTTSMFTQIYKYIDSIYIYSETNQYIVSDSVQGDFESFEDKNWYTSYKNGTDPTGCLEFRKKYDRYPYLLTFIKPYYTNRNQKKGAIIVNINIADLGKNTMINRSSNLEDIFILDEYDNILYNSDSSRLMKKIQEVDIYKGINITDSEVSNVITLNERKYVLSNIISSYRNLRYVSLMPLDQYKKKIESKNQLLFLLILLALLVSLSVAFIISTKAFQPINKIISLIENPRTWDFGKLDMHNGKMNELRYITGNILNTINLNKEQENELQKRLDLLNKAQVEALQWQINPHFLYNALETVRWKAVDLTNGKNEVSKMIVDLSEFFRIGLHTEGHLIPISLEIEHAKIYIEIMKSRYRDKFNVQWDLDENIISYKIVKMSLQPILENAIYHGIKPKEGKGAINVKSALLDDSICFEVTDDGIGMSEAEVEWLNSSMKNL